MTSVVISDLHLGNEYCRFDALQAFLEKLPEGATLVLNGDVVDRWHTRLPGDHDRALTTLCELSLTHRVVWIRGNHDEDFLLPDPAEIEFRAAFSEGNRLLVVPGDGFDNILPYHRLFLKVFRFLHRFHMWLGAEPVHVAFYAKRFARLYDVLRNRIARSAVEHARENGFATVVCGHSHYAEDRVIDGIRYINTGAWTELPNYCVHVDDDTIRLVRIPENGTNG